MHPVDTVIFAQGDRGGSGNAVQLFASRALVTRRDRSFEGGTLGTAAALHRSDALPRCIAVRKIIMSEQDWIELARKARDAAERSLREEAYWLRLIANGRSAKLIDAAKGSQN